MKKLIISLITGFLSIGTLLAAQKADIVLKNATILTINNKKDVFNQGTLVIKGKRIIAVGGEELAKEYKGNIELDLDGDIVMPGMVNAHNHVSMSVFRSLADDVPNRLRKYIFPLEKKLVSREMVYIGAIHGNIEMVKGGVTTFADMYYFEDEVAKATEKIGLRGVLGETVIKFPVADAKNDQEGIAYAVNFIKQYKNSDLITPAFAPHAPHTNRTETLQQISSLSKKYDVPVLMHVAETTREVKKYQDKYKLSPIGYLNKIGVLNKNLVAAHVIFADDNDIKLLKKNDVGIAHNMSANIKSAKGVSPALKMFDRGLRIGLGTDGPMSGNTISTIDEFNQVAKIHKLANHDRAAMPPVKVVEMATMGGARALHMEDKIGSLEVGKLADVTIVDTKATNMIPIYNPYSALVYSANSSNIKHVIVNGKLIMIDRKVLTVDEEKARKAVIEFSKIVRKTVLDSGIEVK